MSEKKCTGLLTILIFELNQMNSEKIMDGKVNFEVKLFIHFKNLFILKISWSKDRNFEKMSLLISILLRNLKFLPNCLPIKNSGVISQS